MWVFILVYILGCYAELHPIYEADGTCLSSCLGMGLFTLMCNVSFIQCIGNLHTQTCTFSGTATTKSHQSTV